MAETILEETTTIGVRWHLRSGIPYRDKNNRNLIRETQRKVSKKEMIL